MADEQQQLPFPAYEDGRRPPKSIWDRLHGGGALGGDGISVASVKRPSGSWGDLKLVLSYPTTRRETAPGATGVRYDPPPCPIPFLSLFGSLPGSLPGTLTRPFLTPSNSLPL